MHYAYLAVDFFFGLSGFVVAYATAILEGVQNRTDIENRSHYITIGKPGYRWMPIDAASIVALMLTTEVLIADITEDEETAAVRAGHGGMGGVNNDPRE
jgi:hypothetical protein